MLLSTQIWKAKSSEYLLVPANLTELRRKENQLLELNHALEEAIEHEAAIHDQLVQAEKFAAMGRMLASVTHEINNPLQTISNCLYLIASDIPSESQASQFLEMAMSETGRISKLVAELKDVYRPHQEYNFTTVFLPDLLMKFIIYSNRSSQKSMLNGFL